jgi:hypothetical protein
MEVIVVNVGVIHKLGVRQGVGTNGGQTQETD